MAKDDRIQTPLRLTSQWEQFAGGLGPGDMAVVMARAGVGKTTFIVQVALDHLLRGQTVLHVTAAQTVEHLQARYDALFEDWAHVSRLPVREGLRAELARRRMITAFSDGGVFLGRIEETADTLRKHLEFQPDVIVLDGYDWEKASAVETAAVLGAARSYCRLRGATLWVTAKTHREVTGPHPTAIPRPCDELASLIQLAVFLEPHADGVHMRALKGAEISDDGILLDADTLRPIVEDGEVNVTTRRLPSSAFTLLSGGATGAEELFGQCAEAFDLKEQNFTFAGRQASRDRGQVILSDNDLAQGAVSDVYLKAKMHPSYPDTALFRRTLQSIWHQVKTAGEVFVVGVVQEDDTVKGGTGWAAELARHWNKPLHVFDQEQRTWLRWTGKAWEQEEAPRIRARRFCGTGTRFLSDEGALAIKELFESSFSEAAESGRAE